MDEEIGTYEEFFDALGQRESSDNYQLVNEGFIGRYQITELILAFGSTDPDLFYYSIDADPLDNQLNGTWTGLDDINSLDDFLASEPAQDNLIRAWFDNYIQAFTDEGYLHYIGQTFDGITLSATSLLAGAHLIGYPELIEFLEGPKDEIPADGFGTEVTEYLQLFAPYEYDGELDIDRSEAVSYQGSPGDDVFIGGGGNDTLIGGEGTDTARYEATSDNYVIVQNPDGSYLVRQSSGDPATNDGTDVLTEMERVQFADRTLSLTEIDFGDSGQVNADQVSGDAVDDTGSDDGGTDGSGDGASGDDTSDDGASGDDTSGDDASGDDTSGDDASGDDASGGGSDTPDEPVEFEGRWRGTDAAESHAGGAGNDILGGLGGNDTLGGRNGRDNLNGGEGDDILGGGGGEDTIRGHDGDDRQFGGGGADIVAGGDGADRGVGGGGSDSLVGGNGDDSLFGKAEDDRLEGSEGADRLRGGGGDDTVLGSEGDDGLRGGGGTDTLNGGTGDDTLIGGDDADLFVFDGPGFGRDRIADFEVGVDQVDVSRYGEINTFDVLPISNVNGEAVLRLGDSDSVRFDGVDASELTEQDFIF